MSGESEKAEVSSDLGENEQEAGANFQASPFLFEEGERVLCFHGPLIYEAKALRCQTTRDGNNKYFIHYAGWNKNWDEWVPENRVLKYTEEAAARYKANNPGKGSKNQQKGKRVGVGAGGGGGVGTTAGAAAGADSEGRNSTPTKDVGTPKEVQSGGRGRLIKQTISNIAAAAAAVAAAAAASASNSGPPLTEEGGSRRKRQRNEGHVENEDQSKNKLEVKIKIPDDLKAFLVDDWDNINRAHKLVELPTKMTVDDIMNAYMVSRKAQKQTQPSKEVMDDICSGIIEYFNVLLGSQLLYKFERNQYAETRDKYPDRAMSSIYGGNHLLRLFVLLGSMLTYTTIDEKQMNFVLTQIHDMLKFFVKHSHDYFGMHNYINTTSEYCRIAL